MTAVVITTLLIILPGPGSNMSTIYSNWTICISAITAAALSNLSTVTAFRTIKILSKGNSIHNQREIDIDKNEKEKFSIHEAKHNFYLCLSLTVGLTIWAIAELTWTYYQLGLRIENPFPSIADSFWLAAYPFVTYFTFGINNTLSKNGNYDREALILLSISAGLLLGYVFNLTFGVADIMSAAHGDVGRFVSILYPILDTIILIPALMIVASFGGRRNKYGYSIHWLLLACSIIILTIADIGFGYSEVLGKAEGEQWFWDIMYASSYIVMAAALYAYFSILSSNRLKAELILHRQPV